MKKFLDIVIIILLTFLIVNIFDSKKEDLVKNTIIVKTLTKDYTIPAGVKLDIFNNTEKNLKINVCKDLKVKYIQGDKILDFPEDFCKNNIFTLKPSETKVIDYSLFYSLFKKDGNYIIKYKDKDISTNFKVEHKGTFSKIFTYLFYAPAYNFIIFLIKIFSGSLGWAIIAITILLRILLLWPQHKMLIAQKKMQEIQPKIKKLQEEYKGNPQILGQKMMELYKKEKVNPMGSCGFMLIQMPILLVIYNVILNITDASNHYYLYSFLKGFDFSSINYHFFGIDLLGKGGIYGLILAIIVGVLQFLQIKLSSNNLKYNKTKNNIVLEKKKGENSYSKIMPDPDMMHKIMLYGMPAMVAVFTYNFPAGLGLYWGITTLFMIIQQIIVNKKAKLSSQS